MYFLALATDYDGTIAHHGVVPPETIAALERFKATGRRLLLVTGREIPDLETVFPRLDLFDRIVAENGALILDPATGRDCVISPGPPPEFAAALAARGVERISVGRAIVATWEPHQNTVLEVIREMELELQIIFNKGAVMVLPAGINKAVGLEAALRELDLTAHNVVGVGDAENDHAFLRACGCAAAVANALASVKAEADVRLSADHGPGVNELVDLVCRDDGAIVSAQRHGLLAGHDGEGEAVYLEPHRGTVLIAGESGLGKSLATALTERMVERKLEFCVLDPEGDYASLENAVSIGDARNGPSATEAMRLVRKRAANVVIDAQAFPMDERAGFFAKLLPQITALRTTTGRPHWMLVDVAQLLLAASRDDIADLVPEHLAATIFITVHPDSIAPAALETVRYVLAHGPHAQEVIATFCRSLDAPMPELPQAPGAEEVLFFDRFGGGAPRIIKPLPPAQQHARLTG